MADGMNCDPKIFQTMAPAVAAKKPGALAIWGEALAGTARFYWNKLLHAYPGGGETGSGPIRQVHAAVGETSATIPYCMGRDTKGLVWGVQPAWMYLHDFSAAGPVKITLMRKLLAQLPGGMSFHFAFHSNLPDGQSVRRAFAACGFKILEWQTYVYTPPASYAGDYAALIDSFTGKSIKGTLRRAMRDLEVIELSPRDYFQLQQDYLAAGGKKNTRNNELDELMLEEAVRHGYARILGARRKSSDEYPGANPVDAALVCLADEAAGLLQLWRLTYRDHVVGTLKPHVDATKLLVLAAMDEAARRKFRLDTDGYTAGMAKQYALFGPGVFRLADRLHCERECLWAVFNRYYPALGRRLGALFARRDQPKRQAPSTILQHR
jgi:hypothetical protein